MGYHITEIPKGVVGQASKIREEFLEFEDAVAQGNTVMALVELSDLLLAIDRYLEQQVPGVRVPDLLTMAAATRRAFETGGRT